MNPIYEIFNKSYIEQQPLQQNHQNQIIKIQKTTKTLKGFLDGVDKIQPAYQQITNNEYCNTL